MKYRILRMSGLILCLVWLISIPSPTRAAPPPPLRRVHAPYFTDAPRWAESGLFWFGQVDLPDTIPGRNYVDVRVAYTQESLAIYPNIEDYYLWYPLPATSSTDLTRYDAVAIYLDTGGDGGATPDTDDYLFLVGLCLYHCGDGSAYVRDARGDGSGWNDEWNGDWSSATWAQWVGNPPHNNNENTFDYGWWAKIYIPWETLGLGGPPPDGTIWRLGVQLFDRDDGSGSGLAPVQHWPETFDPVRPSTWGELAFGPATYEPPGPLVPQGTTVIRRGLGQSVVEDAWVGGGGTCGGGHEGDPDADNHGSDPNLFVANQEWITDFPCFSRSFLRFDLSQIPPGKEIISATLTVYHWSNARWDRAQPSLIWLFTVDGEWEEDTLTWNNAPLARENLTAVWVDVITPENNPGPPGNPYSWDATKAVAEAYAAGVPLNVALYTADTNQHSSKYLRSSEAAPAYADARPTLEVVWGVRAASVAKSVSPGAVAPGQLATYTLNVIGSGRALTLTDDLPPSVAIAGSVQAEGGGTATYDAQGHRVIWTGTPAAGQPVTVTFVVTAPPTGPLAVHNTARLSDAGGELSQDSAVFIVGGRSVYLPLLLRSFR